MIQNKSFGDRVFDIINYSLLSLFALASFLPFIYVIGCSFATQEEILQKGFLLFPTKFSLDAYKYIFSTDSLTRSLLVTVFITVTGTFINIMFTVLMAYPLAHKQIIGRKVIIFLVTFTMMFNPGIIPAFIIVKSLGLLNSYWSLLLPTAISAFNLIIMKNFFQQIPAELEESAKIDGCNDLVILLKIILPLSAPAIATFSLFYAVVNWNSFMNPLMYINDSRKWPIQILLRQIVLMSSGGAGDEGAMIRVEPQTVKMAVVAVSTVPILLVYPFLQKHFVQGVMIGSVKG